MNIEFHLKVKWLMIDLERDLDSKEIDFIKLIQLLNFD